MLLEYSSLCLCFHFRKHAHRLHSGRSFTVYTQCRKWPPGWACTLQAGHLLGTLSLQAENLLFPPILDFFAEYPGK